MERRVGSTDASSPFFRERIPIKEDGDREKGKGGQAEKRERAGLPGLRVQNKTQIANLIVADITH